MIVASTLSFLFEEARRGVVSRDARGEDGLDYVLKQS